MHPHHSLLLTLTLTLLLTTFTNAATPAAVAKGKIPGFLNSWTGSSPHPSSDFLTATFCYCALNNAPTHSPPGIEEAHIFQYEYYNRHTNTTYIIDDLCETTRDAVGPGCLENRNIDHGKHGSKVCRTWRRDPNAGRGGHDTFCYAAADVDGVGGEDAVWFNGQRRELGATGGQGPWGQPEVLVEEACAGLCEAFTGLSVLHDPRLAPNRIMVYEDLDDMCHRCKAKVGE